MFLLFCKDILRQRKRFLLTSMAITWGTISMVLFLAFGEGMKHSFEQSSKGLGEGILIVYGGSTGKAFKGLGTGRPIRLTVEDMYLLRERIPEIERIRAEFLTGDKSFTIGNNTVTSSVSAVFPDFSEMRSNYPVKGGRFINELDIQEKRRVIFLGNELKERLFEDSEAVGRTITLDRYPFLVVGVLQEKMQMSMYWGPDDMKGVIPATTYSSLYGERYIYVMIIQPQRPEDNEFVKDQVRKVLGAKYRFDPEDSRALRMWDTIEQDRITGIVALGIQIFLGIVGGMTLFIAGGGVANMMYVIIRQRTHEIGLKMALGAKRRSVMFTFLLESLLITLTGGFLAIPICRLLIWGYTSLPIENPALQYLGTPVISLNIAVGTVLILGLLGFIAGFFPARKAVSINPMEALRYE